MPPDPKARATTPRREPGTLALAGVVLVVALGAGYLGAQVRPAPDARPPWRPARPSWSWTWPPCSRGWRLSRLVRSSPPNANWPRAWPTGGVLVLDAQAVLAAPADAYLKRQEVTGD